MHTQSPPTQSHAPKLTKSKHDSLSPSRVTLPAKGAVWSSQLLSGLLQWLHPENQLQCQKQT